MPLFKRVETWDWTMNMSSCIKATVTIICATFLLNLGQTTSLISWVICFVKILLSSHHIFVTCKIGDILRACNKEFNFTANYAKGHGGMFFRPGSSGQGQARYNNDMGRAHESMVSGRRGKEQAPNAMIGIFHQLPEELTDSLIVTGRRHGKATRRDFNRRLRLQEEKSEQKEKRHPRMTSWMHPTFTSNIILLVVQWLLLKHFGNLTN